MKKFKKIFIAGCIVLMLSSVLALLVSCKTKKDDEKVGLLDLSTVSNLSAIQSNGDLVFEWVNNTTYNPEKPTLVIFPGEYTDHSMDERFKLELNPEVYTLYDDANKSAPYVVKKDNPGYNNNGFVNNLSRYWQNVAIFNVAIFHWERFADEADPNTTISKLFSIPRMRYKTASGYETTAVPNVSLVELTSALFLEFMPDTAKGKEVRFLGNGVGANLALGVTDFLHKANRQNLLDENKLPTRLALCDPYMTTENLNISVAWAGPNTDDGLMSMVKTMLVDVTDYGVVAEMIETYERSYREETITDSDGKVDTIKIDTSKYAYDIKITPKAEELYSAIKSCVAYLRFDEAYTLRIKDSQKGYLKLKRVALDWYLYSIIGSDDTSVGNPKEFSDSNPLNNNWGVTYLGKGNYTRPILNDRGTSNNGTSSTSMSNNFGVSAWTPTVYTRALKGIGFTLQKSQSTAISDNIHGRPDYVRTAYTVEYFSSEIYQKSDQTNYTLICGYVGIDKNMDNSINDGLKAGLANATINVDIKLKSNESDVANFDVTTDANGYYVINLPDKTKGIGGVLSQSGYCFKETHTITLTCIPKGGYISISNPINTAFYVANSQGHSFTNYTKSFDFNYYYADAISIYNCLVYNG